ncbi:MAG: hypothetical protein LCH76_02025 [Actinobacteria bacterium]|nr:hypothetical protein [Actinomycetota bacterium]
MDFVRLVVLALHLMGMAAILGVFAVQLRQKDGFGIGLLLGGAATQLITGIALVGIAEMGDRDVNYFKIGFKLAITLIVAVAAVLTWWKQRKGENAKPFFHAAGGLAFVNLLVAVFWR